MKNMIYKSAKKDSKKQFWIFKIFFIEIARDRPAQCSGRLWSGRRKKKVLAFQFFVLLFSTKCHMNIISSPSSQYFCVTSFHCNHNSNSSGGNVSYQRSTSADWKLWTVPLCKIAARTVTGWWETIFNFSRCICCFVLKENLDTSVRL